MNTNLRIGLAATMFAVIGGLILMSEPSHAQAPKNFKDATIQIADALKKKNAAGATMTAMMTAANKKQVGGIDDVMQMFRPRSKGGLGVGAAPLGNPAKDGIEVMIRDLARAVPAMQPAGLEEMGYYIAAMGELSKAALAKAPIGGPKKTMKSWTEMSEEMRELGVAFAKASAAKNAKDIQATAAKVNANCNKCHSIFKE